MNDKVMPHIDSPRNDIALFRAACTNDLNAISVLVKTKNVDVNSKNEFGGK